MAQAMRAAMLAMATLTTLESLRSSNPLTQAPVADVLMPKRRNHRCRAEDQQPAQITIAQAMVVG